jgi:uncharacterized protein YggE
MVKSKYGMTRLFSVMALLVLLGVQAAAQDPADRPARPSIRVTGEATVSAKPDQAQIDVGVITQAATAEEAASRNAQKLDATLKELRRLLGEGAEIKTISYSLNPNYVYPREGGQPRISGYIASNTLQATIDKLEIVGKVIDAAAQSGANNIQALRFRLKDEQAVRAQALREAAAKARAKAEVLASALSVSIVRVLHVEEGGQVTPIHMDARAFSKAEAANVQTPVEPGTIDVRATVALTVEVK